MLKLIPSTESARNTVETGDFRDCLTVLAERLLFRKCLPVRGFVVIVTSVRTDWATVRYKGRPPYGAGRFFALRSVTSTALPPPAAQNATRREHRPSPDPIR